ncbi:MAG: GMC family oxidoreductase [Polyangiales bacterium]
MTHIAFRPRGEDVELVLDYVVVGSGAGGATAAVTLARGGEKVAIVEAGPWRDPEDYPHSTYGTMRDMMDDWGTSVVLGRAAWPIVQARIMGGTTVINSAICVRTPGDVFDLWQREWGVGGAAMAEAVWKNQDQVEAELCVEEVPSSSLGVSNLLALRGDRAAHYDGHVMLRYTKGCVGSGQCMQGCRNLKKQSTNVNYVPETMRRGGTVLSCAPVTRVLLEKGRAVGVTGHFVHPTTHEKGAKFTIRGTKGVLMAASVTHTPSILMRSGVMQRNLGKYFRAHPGTGVFGVFENDVDMNRGATQGWASTHFRHSPGIKLETLAIPFEMVASRISGGGTTLLHRLREYRHFAMWIHAVRAESVGRIWPTPFGKPMVTYTLNERDMRVFREGTYLVAKMHFAAGAKHVLPGVHGLPYSIGPDQVELLREGPLDPRAYVAIQSHLFGGAVMGADPRKAVCDANGKVYGYEGLYVVDAAVLPTTLGVNPQHTIMGMAKYFADRLLDA